MTTESRQAGKARRRPAGARRRPVAQSRIWATLKALFRTRVTTGLLVVIPIYITWVVITFVFGLMRSASIWLVELFLIRFGSAYWRFLGFDHDKLVDLRHTNPDAGLFSPGVLPTQVQWGISIAAVLLTMFVLYSVGLFAANLFGRRLIEFMEGLVDRLPIVKTVYRSSKQILETLTGEQSKSMQRVALVPFPSPQMRTVGFITSVAADSVNGQPTAAVFVPTTPNPTSGFLLMVPLKDVVEVDWSVEDAVRIIMSCGILRPDFVTLESGRYGTPPRSESETGPGLQRPAPEV